MDLGKDGSHRRQNLDSHDLNQLRAMIDELSNRLKTRATNQAELIDEAFLELSTALEELQIAEEDLRQQNEDLVAARELLEVERQRYQDLFEFTPESYLMTDDSGTIQEVNQAAVKLLNIPRDKLIGKPLVAFVPLNNRKEFRRIFTALERNEDIKNFTTCVLPRGSDPVDVAVTAVPVPKREAPGVSLRWLIRDITEYKRVTEAFHHSEQRFRTIFEDAKLGILLMDRDLKIIDSNQAFAELIGYRRQELIGLLISKLIPQPWNFVKSKEMERFQSGELEHYRQDHDLQDKNGNLVWVHLSLSLIRNEESVPVYIIAMVEDISLSRQLERELAEVDRRLMDATEVERANIARDLHDGPIQDLYGAIFMLNSLGECLIDAGSLAQLNSVSTILTDVINALRKTVGELRPVTLGNFGLGTALRSHAEQVQAAHPQFKIGLDLANDGKALTDRVRITLFRIYQHAMMNILRHADARSILVRLVIEANQVILEIRDDGKGFVVPKRWIELVRLGHYGLVGAAERAHAIGGRLDVLSQPGEGSVIRVSVPLEDDSDSGEDRRLSAFISEKLSD